MYKHKINELGRSMLEILGVLAVIGILAIGGAFGYKYAMDKYQANDITNSVNQRVKDTWMLYQDKELPTEFEGWDLITSTGFPIDILPEESGDMFTVVVQDVPNDVCKRVLDMGIEQEQEVLLTQITGPDGVNGSYGAEDYTTDNSVCELYEDRVGMRFLVSLDCKKGECTNAVGEPGKPCYSDSDCNNLSSGGCMSCRSNICEHDCPEGKFCKNNTSTPVCVSCTANEHCPEGFICSEVSNACEEIKETCGENEFRTYNGSCVSCEVYSNYRVSTEKFKYEVDGEVKFEDSDSGDNMCRDRCTDENKKVLTSELTGQTFCSYSCTDGYSFQANSGCVTCDTKGIFYLPTGVDLSKEQCETCGDDWVIKTSNGTGTFCIGQPCENGQLYKTGGGTSLYCVNAATEITKAQSNTKTKPTENYGYIWTLTGTEASNLTAIRHAKELCEASGSKYVVKGGSAICLFPCKKDQFRSSDNGRCIPCDASGSYTVAASDWYKNNVAWASTGKADCEKPTCNRVEWKGNCLPQCIGTEEDPKWLNYNRSCFSCTSGTNDTFLTAGGEDPDEMLKARCEACGRVVKKLPADGKWHCVFEGCPPGTFVNKNTKCIQCGSGESGEIVEVANDEACTSACTGETITTGEGEEAVSITTTKRYITNYHDGRKFCVKDYGKGKFTYVTGAASDANKIDANKAIGDSTALAEFCERNENRRVSNKGKTTALCELKTCSEGYFLDQHGNCVSCNTGTDTPLYAVDIYHNTEFVNDKKTVCEACGNRSVTTKKVNETIQNADGTSTMQESTVPYCSRTKCSGREFIHKNNSCQSCDNDGGIEIDPNNSDHVNACKNCTDANGNKNRIVIDKYCVEVVKPTTNTSDNGRGICNDYGNGGTSISGYSDGNGKLFRSFYDGIFYDSTLFKCYSCLTDAVVHVGNNAIGKEQCASCGNRQIANGRCIKGHCTQGAAFMTENGCVYCKDVGGSRFAIDPDASQECLGCGSDFFVQNIDEYKTIYEFDSVTGEVIGTEISPIPDPRFYCMKKTDTGFIGANGNTYSCSTTESPLIGYDYQSELMCQNCNRKVTEDNECAPA